MGVAQDAAAQVGGLGRQVDRGVAVPPRPTDLALLHAEPRHLEGRSTTRAKRDQCSNQGENAADETACHDDGLSFPTQSRGCLCVSNA